MRAVILLAGAVLSAAVLAACNGGASEPPVLLETSPTPTASPESGGMDGFRAFAALIEEALAEDDGSFFADRGEEDEMTCTGDEQLGPCLDQPADTVLRGIPRAIAQSDAFALITPNDYAAALQDWFADARPDLNDSYGSGDLVLYALAHRPADESREEAYQAIVTGIFTTGPDAIGSDAFRQARIFSFQFLDDSWRLTHELLATVPSTAIVYFSDACTECFDRWKRWEGAP